MKFIETALTPEIIFLVNNFKCVMQQKELEKGRELNDNL